MRPHPRQAKPRALQGARQPTRRAIEPDAVLAILLQGGEPLGDDLDMLGERAKRAADANGVDAAAPQGAHQGVFEQVGVVIDLLAQLAGARSCLPCLVQPRAQQRLGPCLPRVEGQQGEKREAQPQREETSIHQRLQPRVRAQARLQPPGQRQRGVRHIERQRDDDARHGQIAPGRAQSQQCQRRHQRQDSGAWAKERQQPHQHAELREQQGSARERVALVLLRQRECEPPARAADAGQREEPDGAWHALQEQRHARQRRQHGQRRVYGGERRDHGRLWLPPAPLHKRSGVCWLGRRERRVLPTALRGGRGNALGRREAARRHGWAPRHVSGRRAVGGKRSAVGGLGWEIV